jgi:phage terminase large subunit GpA-like protein
MKTSQKTPPSQPSLTEEERESFYNTSELFRQFSKILRPPSRVPLSEWSDKYRILSPESSAESGQWITSRAPYEKEMMDAISDPFTPKVVIQKASQVGATDCAILNPVGYYMDEDPCPILVVQPTLELAQAFSTDRLAPMLRDSPRLRGKVTDPRSRDSMNTLYHKGFRGGFVQISGANSASSLSGRPVRVVLLDDVDRYPASAGTEGNPLKLATARTSAFWNRKIVIVSSPSTQGVSHIEREMNMSTQEHWYLPCPVCNFYQILDWDRIKFADMTHGCLSCGLYRQKHEWLSHSEYGEWRAHRPVDSRGKTVKTRGFFLSGLYSPWIEWDLLVEEFVTAVKANEEGDIELLKAFRNTRLGLLHEDKGQSVEIDLYAERREEYSAEIPEGVLVLTAGVDVGDSGLTYEIVGWGKGRECWGIEYGILDGNPREQEVWDMLDESVFYRVFTCHDGKRMRVRRMPVDSNYISDYVYQYTKPRQPRAISIRGEGGLGKPFIKSAGILTKFNKAHLITLGVDTAKEETVARLNVMRPGAGFCHFPKLANGEPARGYDEEYFKGLCAEQRKIKSKHGFRTFIWVKRLSQHNEPFDCRIYAMAGIVIPWSGIRLEEMGRDLLDPRDENDRSERSAKAVSRYGAQTPQQAGGGYGAGSTMF